jgi:hypothetical protein
MPTRFRRDAASAARRRPTTARSARGSTRNMDVSPSHLGLRIPKDRKVPVRIVLGAADREGPDAFYPADTPQTAKPSSTLIWEGPVKDAKTEVGCCPLVRTGLTSTGPGTVTAMVCHSIRPVMQDSGQQDHGNRDLNQYSGGRSDRPDCGRGAHVSQVLARERTVAVEANPRAISQMPNVSSNNPPGMAPTSPAPATPNSSSRLPPAKHA